MATRRSREEGVSAATVSPAALVLIALACWCPTPCGGGQAAVAVDSPFHPLLCDTAIAAAHRASDFGSPTACDLALLADGLFCRGMQDDPIALDASIRLFEQRHRAAPTDVRVTLRLAAALHRRYPRADRPRHLLREARDSLAGGDLGAAAPTMARAIAQSLAALETSRDAVRSWTGASDPINDSPRARAARLFARGPEGQHAAARLLAGTRDRSDRALGTLVLAETIAPSADYDRLRALYGSAVTQLCRDPSSDCSLARRRLAQVEWIRQRAPCAVAGASAR